MLDVEFVERSFFGKNFLLQYDLVAFFPSGSHVQLEDV